MSEVRKSLSGLCDLNLPANAGSAPAPPHSKTGTAVLCYAVPLTQDDCIGG
jgi:hypothetical protein